MRPSGQSFSVPTRALITDFKGTSLRSQWFPVPQPGSPLKSMGTFKTPGLHSWKFQFKRHKARPRNLHFFQNSLANLPAEPCLGITGLDTTSLHIWLQRCKDRRGPALWAKKLLSAERETPQRNSMRVRQPVLKPEGQLANP